MAQREWTETLNDIDIKEPKLYKVVMWNDDYTTMDFVVEILADIFHRSYDEAIEIMLAIHERGKGVCGRYTYEVAETKIYQATKRARENQFPLRLTMERD